MSRIADKIRAYVNDYSVSEHYGEWGILRPDQRRQIRELCDTCDMFEKTADEFAHKQNQLKGQEKFFEALKADIAAADKYIVGVIQHDETQTGIDRAQGFIDKFAELADADASTKGKYVIEKEVKKNIETEVKIEPVITKTYLGEFILTAYCPCEICCGEYGKNRPVDENGKIVVYGSIGERLKQGVSIAVDPSVIPYGSKVEIEGHVYTAQDCGGAIKKNRVDVYFENHKEAWNFGEKQKDVFLIERNNGITDAMCCKSTRRNCVMCSDWMCCCC